VTGTAACITRDGDALRVSGALVRAHVAALWAGRPADASGVRRIDLTAVERIDSAGLALVSLLASAAAPGLVIEGQPTGYRELQAAYRLGPSLDFARD
jgi:phospholipid transport system transporter-binding protein